MTFRILGNQRTILSILLLLMNLIISCGNSSEMEIKSYIQNDCRGTAIEGTLTVIQTNVDGEAYVNFTSDSGVQDGPYFLGKFSPKCIREHEIFHDTKFRGYKWVEIKGNCMPRTVTTDEIRNCKSVDNE